MGIHEDYAATHYIADNGETQNEQEGRQIALNIFLCLLIRPLTIILKVILRTQLVYLFLCPDLSLL